MVTRNEMEPELGAEPADLLMKYALILLPHWKTILISVLIASGITGVISKFFLTKWYKATAILNPVPQAAIQGQLGSLMGALGSGAGASLSGLLGGAGGTESDEYVSIVKSFGFARNLILKHDLIGDILRDDPPSTKEFIASRHLQWLAYRNMKSRLRCETSYKTGQITIEYEDTDPANAERIAGYIVDDLREILRRRQIDDAKAAIDSLQQEAKRSNDPMIEAALYQLIAVQVQRQKTAEAQADFAFNVIEAPAASDVKVWPPTLIFCTVMALTTFAACASYICITNRGRAALSIPD